MMDDVSIVVVAVFVSDHGGETGHARGAPASLVTSLVMM